MQISFRTVNIENLSKTPEAIGDNFNGQLTKNLSSICRQMQANANNWKESVTVEGTAFAWPKTS